MYSYLLAGAFSVMVLPASSPLINVETVFVVAVILPFQFNGTRYCHGCKVVGGTPRELQMFAAMGWQHGYNPFVVA